MRTVALLVVAGCWSSRTPPVTPNVDGPPTIRLAVAKHREVAIAEASATGVVVKSTVQVPSTIDTMFWVGDDPVVMLVAKPYDESGTSDEKLDGTVGRITAKGFETYAPLPATTWASLETPLDGDYFEVSRWKLVVTPNNEVWQGHCKRAFAADT